jgi:3-oxoacyl-[acyl-carrier protein] reductase
MCDMSDLRNKVVAVFGGGRDIGGAVAVELARQGALVAMSYHTSNPASIVSAIEAMGQTPLIHKVDTMNGNAVREFAPLVAKKIGKPISVLVNVVGGLVARKKMEEMDDLFWDEVMALNVRSVFAMTQATLPHMADGGAIVNISSQAGRDGGGPGAIAYAASKGALMSMTRGLAKELGPRRIRVNAVCPGMISTRFHDQFTQQQVRQHVAAMTPLGREGKAEEVARLVAYLASDDASFVNGTNVDINGGLLFS